MPFFDASKLLITNITKKYKHIKSFCNGLKKDWEAVCNAILFDWNNGILEGSVNRLKAKKREIKLLYFCRGVLHTP